MQNNTHMNSFAISISAGSSMIYTFAQVRKFVRETLNENNWYRPELILTRGFGKDTSLRATFTDHTTSMSGFSTDYNKYLKYPITADAVYKFINHPDNKKILSEHLKQSDFNVNEDEELFPNVIEALERLSSIDGDIEEFDDEFHTKECVYTLTVNRSNKRITVCFRGSANIHNWRYNFWIRPKAFIDAPKILADEGFKGKIGLHPGFNSKLKYMCNSRESHGMLLHFVEHFQTCAILTHAISFLLSQNVKGYLMEECDHDKVKFDDILGQIRAVYANPKYKDYDLYVTGHSLGGALSSLLSFYLVSSGKLQDIMKDKPVTNISFASPRPGNDEFDKAFQELEAKGLLRHIRISNSGDLAPTFPQIFGYTHTGINLLLYKTKQLFINRESSILRGHFWNPFEYLSNHGLKEHYTRIQREDNCRLLNQYESVAKFYKDYLPKSEE